MFASEKLFKVTGKHHTKKKRKKKITHEETFLKIELHHLRHIRRSRCFHTPIRQGSTVSHTSAQTQTWSTLHWIGLDLGSEVHFAATFEQTGPGETDLPT